MKSINDRLTIGLITIFLLLAGCAGPGLKIQSIALNEDPVEQLEIMEKDLEDARIDEVHKLSPNWYKKAISSYDTAKALHSEGGKIKDIYKNLSLSHAQLDRAETLAPIAKVVLVPVTKARKEAIDAGANKSTKGFLKAEDQYLNLTALVENDKRKKAENKSPKVRNMFKAVELEAITDRALNPARNRLKEALNLKAKKLAPKSLARAKKQIESATKYITENRYETEDIDLMASQALFLADRLVMITKEAAKIKKDLPEDTALRIESMTERIASNLSLPDMRNLEFSLQTNEIVKSIGNVIGVRDALQSKSVDLEGELRKVASAHETQVAELEQDRSRKLGKLKSELSKEESLLARLKKEKEFEALVKSVNRDFAPGEAEVYRQGNTLVLRLRGVNFPVGKATIPTKNYPILAKVTNTIKKFDPAKVIVEGHTDSVGPAETNDRLSQLRAKAVSDYLGAHGATTKDRIQTKGFGYRRPIATNKTRDGRKKNRRIDVIVDLN